MVDYNAIFDIVKYIGIFFIQILDILIISYVIYKIFTLIKDTRATQMFRGLVIFFIFTVIAGLCNLSVIEWIFKEIWSISLIVAVVVFQPEIRNVLAEVGRNRIISIKMKKDIIEHIIEAVKFFSKKEVGALIVLERSTGLKNYIEAGVKLNSNISQELLKSIFNIKSPLHDGAVIVSRNTIAAAACFLPLSRAELDKSIGSRHRAALGISEVSDAVVIVVSEETGGITLAIDGILQWKVSEEYLKEVLSKSYYNKEIDMGATVKKLLTKDRLKRNFKFKLAALCLGIILWYYVRTAILQA